MRAQLKVFIFRWLLNSLGLWIALRLFGGMGVQFSGEQTLATFLLAGLVFSIVNTVLKPMVIILSLPAILLTLGLFMLVVNGFMVWLSINLIPGIQINFTTAIVAGLVMSLVNYVVSGLVEIRNKPQGLQT